LASSKLIEPLINQARITRDSLKSASRWQRLSFTDIPAIFGNAMPKSGSHLVLQILQGLAQTAPFRYVSARPVRMITPEGRNRSTQEILKDLQKLRAGAIGWGYLRSEPDFVDYFNCHKDCFSFFVYRDPRDRLISSIFYAVEIHKGHAQHDFFSSMPMDERITAAIKGRDEPGLLHLPNIKEQYARYIGWHDCPTVLCLQFEDLIQNSEETLVTILDFIEARGFRIPTPRNEALALIQEAIRPDKSPTFRKGKAGGWREHFTQHHKALFKEIAGDLLIQLGYEHDNNW
jgi:hypothetical protein